MCDDQLHNPTQTPIFMHAHKRMHIREELIKISQNNENHL